MYVLCMYMCMYVRKNECLYVKIGKNWFRYGNKGTRYGYLLLGTANAVMCRSVPALHVRIFNFSFKHVRVRPCFARKLISYKSGLTYPQDIRWYGMLCKGNRPYTEGETKQKLKASSITSVSMETPQLLLLALLVLRTYSNCLKLRKYRHPVWGTTHFNDYWQRT